MRTGTDAICGNCLLYVVGPKAGVYPVGVNGVGGTFELQTDNIFEK